MKFSPLLSMAFAAILSLPGYAKPHSTAPISQIVITSYTGGGGSADPAPDPIHRIVLCRDGSATYVGSATYSFRVGRYQGQVNKSDFSRIANVFEQNNFRSWPNKYNDLNRSTLTSVKYEIYSPDGKKTIRVYEESGSKLLDRVDHIWYGLLWKINWQKVSSSDTIADKEHGR